MKPAAYPKFEQDPLDDLDYGFVGSHWLIDGDLISSVIWTAEPGITLGASVINSSPVYRHGRMQPAGTCFSVFVSGGVRGQHYDVTGIARTVQNRTKVVRFRIVIRESQ